MTNKEFQKFCADTDRRITSLQRLIERQRDEIVELANAQIDVSDLRRRVAALEADIERLKSAQPIASAPVPHETKRADGVGAVREERGVSISFGEPVATNMPSKGELRRLLQIVAGRYSQFANVPEELFADAFRFIQSCSRTEKLDGHAIGYWLEEAAEFSHNHDITPHAVVAAAIAAGDIQFSDPTNPWFSSFALHRHGPNTGTTAWRGVLGGGGILQPIPTVTDRTIGHVREIRAG